MKIWVDDVREPPVGYVWCKTTNEAKTIITCMMQMRSISCEWNLPYISIIDLDHDAGDYAKYGGDYIEILNWLEKQYWTIDFPFRLHTMNPVGRENMRRILKKNNWLEVQ